MIQMGYPTTVWIRSQPTRLVINCAQIRKTKRRVVLKAQKLAQVFAQPLSRWMPALVGRQVFMQRDCIHKWRRVGKRGGDRHYNRRFGPKNARSAPLKRRAV